MSGERRRRCPDCGCVVHTDGRGKRGTHHYGDMAVCDRVRTAEYVARALGEAFAEHDGTMKAQSQARAAYFAWRGVRDGERRLARALARARAARAEAKEE